MTKIPGLTVGSELSVALNKWAKAIKAQLGQVAADRFEKMMRDTWTRTMSQNGDGIFVITGDIPAMWLRDSSAQVWPFLRLIEVPQVHQTLAGIVRQQWRLVAKDQYANAFNATDSGNHFDADDLDLLPGVWERKYEIDSLAFPIQLAHQIWQLTNNASHLVQVVHAGCAAIVELWRTEQHHEQLSNYRHVRPTEPIDTLPNNGSGSPVAYTGMTWSGFRPSDDACQYGYNIPAQLMAAKALRQIVDFAQLWSDTALAEQATKLREEILTGVNRYGIIGGCYAYEVDGLGNQLRMDDANMPSLLSLPLVSDVVVDDPIYLATRNWVLGADNPFYYQGSYASGVGSPHTPQGFVWHIGLAVQGLTGSVDEGIECLRTILDTDGGTGWTHESFDPNNPVEFTREWFSWSNSMACELMMKLVLDTRNEIN